jgi:phosphopantothenoylcysteine decarboxylase/phosphopantothenate--cysteine ligase
MKLSWRGKRVLITAGPTREPLDPVRYLSNASSGKTGYALAEAARRKGARVTLVSGPTHLKAPAGVQRVPVVTARDMLAACLKALPGTDLVIGAAAVADWRPAATAARKLKKGPSGQAPAVRLVPNPDILKTLAGRRKKGRPVMVGFALETENLAPNAQAKLARKGLDLIVANGPAALDGDRTRALLLTRTGDALPFEGPKKGLAEKILWAAEAFL